MKSGISKLSAGMFLTLAVAAVAGTAVSSAEAGGGGYSRGGHGYGGGHGHGRHYGGGSSISFSFSSGGYYGSSVSIGSGWCAPRYYPRPIAYCPPPVYFPPPVYCPPPVYYAPPVYYRPAPVVYVPPTLIYIESSPRTVVVERPVVRETVYVDRPVTVETRVENRTIQTIRDDGTRVTVPNQSPTAGSDIPTDAVKPQGYAPSRQFSPSNTSNLNNSQPRMATNTAGRNSSRDVYKQLQASTAAAGTSVTKVAPVGRPTASQAVALAKQPGGAGGNMTILPASTTKIQPAQPTRVASASTTTRK